MTCSTEGCTNAVWAKGRCSYHYQLLRTAGKICSIAECGKPLWAKGWCHSHYQKWRRSGDPLTVMRPRRTIAELFTEYMPGTPPEDGCWDWTMSTQSQGYGRFTYIDDDGRDRHMLAHRASHIIYNSDDPITDEKPFVLHSCDRPICCQPAHLMAGPQAENVQQM